MSKTTHKLFEPITSPDELRSEVDRAGADFVRFYMDELAENSDQFRTKELKNQYLDFFYNCCFTGQSTKKEMREKASIVIRIVESGLTAEALEYAASEGSMHME